jgi:hypothetical protein
MARKEAKLRRALRLPVALIERVQPAPDKSPRHGATPLPRARRTA